MSVVPRVSIAGCIDRRIASSRSPSSRSCETATVPPAAREHGGDRVRLDVRGRPVGLDRQLRGAGGGRLERQQGMDGGEGCGIHQLHDRRLHARGGDGGGCLGGRADIGEGGGDRADVAGNQPAELQRRADDDAERPLGADDERREVEAGHALHGAMPEAEQAPVGEHQVDAEDGIPHDSVLRAQQTAGARRDVAADGGDGAAGGIRRPPQAVLRERGVEVGVEDAGFDDGEQIVRPHLEDAVHAAHRQGDLTRAGVRAAGEAGARAARHDRRARLGGDAQGRLHVGDRDARGRRRAGCRMPRAPTCRPVRTRSCGRRRVDAIAERGAQPREDVRPAVLTRTGGGRRSRRR